MSFIIQDLDTRMYLGDHDRWVRSPKRATVFLTAPPANRTIDFWESNTDKRLGLKPAPTLKGANK